jgi:lipopolysaccharide heptosyltransferase I
VPPPRRLLLVKLSSLGDVAHALPLAEALRAGLGPAVHIAWAVRAPFAPLLDGNPHLNAVHILPDTRARSLIAFVRLLRAERFDTALDAQGLLVSGIVTALSGAPRRIGFDRGREGNRLFLTDPIVPARARRHMVAKLLGFCDALGIPSLPPRPQTYLAQAGSARADELLRDIGDGPVVGCIVGASTPEKAWPAASWSALAKTLAAEGISVVLLGGAGEAQAAEQIARDAEGAVAVNCAGQTPLRVLATVLARCTVVVGGDSGPTHLAVAVGTRVVGLYGVTDPERTGPDWGPARSQTLDVAVDSAPPQTRRPRHPTVADALARIPVAAVTEAVRILLR